ncbi:LST8 protein, partial [Columbina picui]|nr:LST8 protein [Columbina picui]
MNAAQGTVGSDPVILATAGYDHTVRFWQAHSGICTRTVQHQDSVSFPAAPGPGQFGGAAPGHLRDGSQNSCPSAGSCPSPEKGREKNPFRLVFSGICTLSSDSVVHWPTRILMPLLRRAESRLASVDAAVSLQAELIVGDQSGAIHIWDLKTDHNEQLIPEPEVSVNSVHIDPDASYMAAVNSSGNCYVWNLTGGIGEEVTQLIPKTKIPAHNRYALQCKFSPDST